MDHIYVRIEASLSRAAAVLWTLMRASVIAALIRHCQWRWVLPLCCVSASAPDSFKLRALTVWWV